MAGGGLLCDSGGADGGRGSAVGGGVWLRMALGPGGMEVGVGQAVGLFGVVVWD